jgi:nitronate monooxygenase
MSRTWPVTTATRLFGIDLPIVLGPFGGLSSVSLTAAVSNAGGLGSYGLYGYDGQRIRSTAAELAAATDRPIALNVWLPFDDDVHPSQREFDGYVENVRPYFEQLHLPLPERPERYLPSFDEQLDAVLEARPAVFSTVFGVPSIDVIDACHARNILVVGTATTVDEAKALDAGGVDAIVASGMEAGGHRTSFLRPAEDSLVGTMALVPQVVDAVSVPVIAAGGIADARGVAAALTLGAAAVQLGSVFLATDESAASPVHRAALRERSGHTVLTRALSGRLARGIPNRITQLSPDRIAPFPVQNWLTGRFRPTAAERGVSDLMSLWAGQASPLIRHTDARTLVESLARDAGALLR